MEIVITLARVFANKSVDPTFDNLPEGTFFPRKINSSDLIFHYLLDRVSATTNNHGGGGGN